MSHTASRPAATIAALAISLGAALDAAPVLAQTVTAAPATGHPTAVITISGKSFANLEAIDVYLDTSDTLLTVSSATGTFSASVTLPATVSPGTHYVTAIGRRSGDAAQATVTVSTPWVESGYGAAHLGWNPYENTVNSSNAPYLGPLWAVPTQSGIASPTVVGGRVYVTSSGGQGVESLNASSGAVIWSALPGIKFSATPAVVNKVLYVGASSTNAMYALNSTTGTTVWNTPTGGNFISGSPVVVGGTVYAGCNDGRIYAFQASTGNILWSYLTGSNISSSPSVMNGVLYASSEDDNVYALNATTGSLIWKYATGGSIFGSPVIANGIVYVGSEDQYLYAIHGGSGALLWRFETGGSISGSPAVAGGVVYFGSEDGYTYALNAHAGTLRWKAATAPFGGYASTIIANGVIYEAGLDGAIYALDTYGDILWTVDSGAAYLESTPVVSDGVVYLNVLGGNTIAFAPAAGTAAVHRLESAPSIASLHPDLSLPVTP